MHIRRRTIQMLKWTGTIACALLAIVIAASLKFSFGYRAHDGSNTMEVFIESGHARYFQWSNNTIERNQLWTYFPAGWFMLRMPAIRLPDAGLQPLWLHRVSRPLDGTTAGLALWLPYMMILIPTLIFWHRDRRPPPGHCPHCRYNLTGNTTGVCPECGLVIHSPSPAAPAPSADPP